MKIEELKNLTKCKYCNETYDVPMVLACSELICKRHIESGEFKLIINNIKCPFCNENHQVPEKINLTMKKLVDLEVNKIDLGKKFTLAKQELSSLDQLIKEFELLNSDPETYIYDYYSELRSKVNLRREELIHAINVKYEEIIDDLKVKETESKQETVNLKVQLSENIIDLRVYFDGLTTNFNNMSFNEKKSSKIIMEANYCKTKVIKGLKEYQERLLLKRELEFNFETSNDQNILGDLIISDCLDPINEKCFLEDFESNRPMCLDINMEKASVNNILTGLEYNSYEQYKFSFKFLNKQFKLAEKWYLINKEWYDKWLVFIEWNNFNSLEWPGVINNNPILNQGFNCYNLKSNLIKDIDYHLVCQELWEYLSKVYSVSKKDVFILIVIYCG